MKMKKIVSAVAVASVCAVMSFASYANPAQNQPAPAAPAANPSQPAAMAMQSKTAQPAEQNKLQASANKCDAMKDRMMNHCGSNNSCKAKAEERATKCHVKWAKREQRMNMHSTAQQPKN